MDFTPKDLGETPPAPDMSNFKTPLTKTSEGNIFIEKFIITSMSTSEKSESLTEAVKKESQDSCI